MVTTLFLEGISMKNRFHKVKNRNWSSVYHTGTGRGNERYYIQSIQIWL